MKCLAFLFLIAVASAKTVPSLYEEEEVAEQFVECIRKALDGGLASAKIPDHNPLVIHRNVEIPMKIGSIMASLKLTDIQVDGIVNAVIENMKGAYSEDKTEIDYAFKFNYDKMAIRGKYAASVSITGGDSIATTAQGTFNIALKNLSFTGDWDMDTTTKQLKKFDVKLVTGGVSVDIQGIGKITNALLDLTASPLLTLLINMNSEKVSEILSPALQTRLNTMWLDKDHQYRIDAIIENCKKH